MEPLKNLYNPVFVHSVALAVSGVHSAFPTPAFEDDVVPALEPLELKQRGNLIVQKLHQYLDKGYTEQVDILLRAIPEVKGNYPFALVIFSDFVGQYGTHDFETSFKALEVFTTYSTAEFAIRRFFMKDFDKTMEQMHQWSRHTNHHVRRLSSEGSRPRLPWGSKVPQLSQNPEYTLPILHTLKADDSLYVRKSVANHLNDIAALHPERAVQVAVEWGTHHPHTAWIVKHGMRNLLKKGDATALSIMGFDAGKSLTVNKLHVNKSIYTLGDEMLAEYELLNETGEEVKIQLDYEMQFAAKNGKPTKKIFKHKNAVLKPGESITGTIRYTFRDYTTRTHHPGTYGICVVINGKKSEMKTFSFHR